MKTERLEQLKQLLSLARHSESAKDERILSLEARNAELQARLANALQAYECVSYMRVQMAEECDMLQAQLDAACRGATVQPSPRGLQ